MNKAQQMLRHSAIRALFIILAACGVNLSAQTSLELVPEYFVWREYVDGEQVLEETGGRIGVEFAGKSNPERGGVVAFRTKLYYGQVDYDGQLQDGTSYQTETVYAGWLLEGGGGCRIPLNEHQALDLMGRLGMELWLRRLDPDGSAGYDEYWLPFYLKVGAEVAAIADKGWMAGLGLKVPLYTAETVDLDRQGGGTITLNPKPRLSPYFEGGYKYKAFSVLGYFDSYWFNESDPDGGIYQPESLSLQVGVRLAWNF